MNTNDLVVGFDPTSSTTITGAQLAQLVNSATPSSDRGFILVTTDVGTSPNRTSPVVPQAQTTTEWQRFLWLQISPSTGGFNVYAWNPNQANANTNLLNWIPISNSNITSGTILNYMLAGGITADKLAGNIATSQLANGANFLLAATQPAAGDIKGSYSTGLFIDSGKVTNAALGTNAVATANIQDGAVLVGKLDKTGTTNTYLANASANAPSWQPIPSIVKPSTPVNSNTGNAGKVPQVLTDGASDSGTWGMVAPTTLGRILQIQLYTSTAIVNSSGALANTTSTPNYNATGMTPLFNTGAFNKNDTTGTSKLHIRVRLAIQCNNTTTFVGLYNATGAVAPIAGLCWSEYTGLGSAVFAYVTAANPANATYYVAFGTTSGTIHMNSIDGTTNPFLITFSEIEITEYI